MLLKTTVAPCALLLAALREPCPTPKTPTRPPGSTRSSSPPPAIRKTRRRRRDPRPTVAHARRRRRGLGRGLSRPLCAQSRRRPARRAGGLCGEEVGRRRPPVDPRFGHRQLQPQPRDPAGPGRHSVQRGRRLRRLPADRPVDRPLHRGLQGRQRPALRRRPAGRGDQSGDADRPDGRGRRTPSASTAAPTARSAPTPRSRAPMATGTSSPPPRVSRPTAGATSPRASSSTAPSTSAAASARTARSGSMSRADMSIRRSPARSP
jgi:hypothetical protein